MAAAVPATNDGVKKLSTMTLGQLYPEEVESKEYGPDYKTRVCRWNILYRKTTEPAVNVLKTLYSNKINSVPLFDEEKKQFVGFIDDQDMLQYALGQFFADIKREDSSAPIENGKAIFSENDLKQVVEKLGRIHNFVESLVAKGNPTAIQIASVTSRNAWRPLKWTSTMAEAFETFSTHKVRRIPILGEHNQLQYVLTRTDLLDWFFENINSFNDLKTCPLTRIPSAKKDVILMPYTARAVDAFLMIHQKGLSAVGVTDHEGKVVASVKLTDIKRVEGNIGPRMAMGLHEYWTHQEKKRVLYIGSTAAFGGVVNMLHLRSQRRVFIFDPVNNRPIGVVSQSDVIDEVVRFKREFEAGAGGAAAAPGGAPSA